MSSILYGSYGVVKIEKGKHQVTKKIDIEEYGTLTELAFVNSFLTQSFTFFPQLINVSYRDGYVRIVMSYCGHNLTKLTPNGIYVPQIVNQMSSILNFFSNQKIIHMDIKPDNICYIVNDKCTSVKITLIDFGFAIPNNGSIINHIGTYMFADPSYNFPRVHLQSYDVYSFGMAMFIWLNNDEDDKEKDNDAIKYWNKYTKQCDKFHRCIDKGKYDEAILPQYLKYEQLLNLLNYEYFILGKELNIDPAYIRLFASMINYNEDLRPRADQFTPLTCYDITDNLDFPMNKDLKVKMTYEMCTSDSPTEELRRHCCVEAQYCIFCIGKCHKNNIKFLYETCNINAITWEVVMNCE